MEEKLHFPPLSFLILFFILGIIFAYFKHINFFLFSILTLLSFILFLIFRKENWNAFLIVLLSFLLGVIHFENKRILPKNDIRNLKELYKGVDLKIRVSSFVEERISFNRKKFVFLAKVISLKEGENWFYTSGKINTYCFGEKPNFEYGDILICKGKLINLHKRSMALFLKSYKVMKHSNHFLKYVYRIRKKLNETINNSLPYPHQAVLSALILGEKRIIPKEIKEAFIRTGTIHILAISGLHVGLIIYLVYLILKLLRISRNFSYLILLLFMFFYSLLTGVRVPVVRASIMAGVYLLGKIFKRETTVLNSLAFACWIILLFNPEELFNVGFQLSFLVVLSIVIFISLSEGWFRNKNKIKKYFLKGLLVSFSAWLGSLGIIGYYFKIITPVAIFANLLLIPLAFLTLATGLGLLFLPSPLSYSFGNTNFLFIDLLLKTLKLLSKFEWASIPLRSFSFFMTLGYYMFLVVLVTLFLILKTKNYP